MIGLCMMCGEEVSYRIKPEEGDIIIFIDQDGGSEDIGYSDHRCKRSIEW